jgi:hypothetical protein
MNRSTLALVAAAAVLSTSGTVAVQQIVQPSTASADTATDREMLRELKKINASLGSIGRPNSVVGLLYDTKNGALKDICRNTRPDGSFSGC